MLERILQQMRLQCFCVGGKTLNVIQRYSTLFVIRYSTRFAAMLQNKLHIFFLLVYRILNLAVK